ncbi:ATP-binding protein [Hymenobacter perfusus]|uniref:ATP-binding protein n=1 Tax=Hymenobacter perfusus TaxID=1236770 RepID=A0A428JWG0_9BACT|nr:ATP-binding protein [Hymenobacter perfusus]RSK38458.1 ATP-binding protein [Hymenobacter perfusus]
METSPGRTHRVACSIKSNQQFTAQGFPAEFVRSAWEQLLTTPPEKFDAAVDFVGFITSPLNADYASDLSDLLNRAGQQDPATLAQEIDLADVANERVRKLYKSFACPADLVERYPEADTRTGWGLSRLIWQAFDFEEQQSRRVVEVRQRLRAALVSETAAEATELWAALCAVGKKLRPHAGSRTLARLADELRYRFRLREYPDDRADWARVREAAESAARQVPELIGGRLVLPREAERAGITEAFASQRALVLRGASGTGKSVLARQELSERASQEPVLWLDAESLRGKTLAGLRQELGLQESLATLLRNNTAARGLCVIDRLDKVYDNTFGVVAELIRLLRLDAPGTPWQLLVPMVSDEWDRVQSRLLGHGIPLGAFRVVEIGVPGPEEREQVWAAFPQLAPLRLRPHLNDVLLRPKMLDILARSIALDQGLDDVVGEASVAARWLRNLGQEGTVKQEVYARTMAVIQADTWQNALPVSELPPLNNEAIEELVQQRVCVKKPGRVAFEHDLYGDWLRLAQLREEARRGSLVAYLSADSRLNSPLWQRAVRLYGVALLDEQPTAEAWKRAFAALVPLGQTAQDLLLEATWYAADPVVHLTTLWPLLTADDGTLLKRLLTHFMHAATRPNERILKLVSPDDPALLQRAATVYRTPVVGYWPHMLLFLYQQRHDIPFVAGPQVAEVVHIWLRSTVYGVRYRAEAAVVAVELGDMLLKEQQAYGFWAGGLGKTVWPAVLEAAVEEPSRVAQLVLEAAGRRPARFLPPPTAPDPDAGVRKSFDFDGPPRPQWPEGPARRVDNELQKAALESLGLKDLLQAAPAVAYELALALLIEEPKPRKAYQFDTTYGLEKLRDWQGAFPQNGPFLLFLEHDEALGINLVLQLEKRALAGWAEDSDHDDRPWPAAREKDEPAPSVVPSILLDLPAGTHSFTGNANVYGWHQGAHPSSGVMTGALMALEKYLYNRLDAGEDITGVLEDLLRRAGSVALLGVLVQVAKYDTGLLLGVLQPLLGSPELQQWDSWLCSRRGFGDDFFGLIRSEQRRQELHKWKNLPHRKISFQELAQHYFLRLDEGRVYFAAARLRWLGRLALTTMPDTYETFSRYFDIANYTFTPISETEQYAEYQEVPAKRKEHENWQATQRLNSILYSTVTKNNMLKQTAEGPLSDEVLEQLWAEAEYLDSVRAEALAQATPISSVADVAAAIAAIGLLRGRAWLARHPHRAAWCREITLSGAVLLWEQRNAELDQQIGTGLHWTDFQAEGLAALWAEHPGDEAVRRAIGQWMLAAPMECVSRLVTRASGHRALIGEDYYRAAHLRLLRAAHWYQVQYPDGKSHHQLAPKALAKLARQRDEWLTAFMERRLSNALPALHDVVGPKRPRHKKQLWESAGHRRELDWHPFHEKLMVAAYTGLPTPMAEPGWLPFWEEALVDTLARLQPGPEEAQVELDGHLHEWDVWLFQQVAGWLADLPAVEARRLWEPVMALGLWAHEWVKDFLNEWTQFALRQPDNPAVRRVWQEMIDYAQNSPAWLLKDHRLAYHHRGELWRALLVLDYTTRWQAHHGALAESFHPRWAAWARAQLGDAGSAAALARFLAQPAAGSMVLEGLPWLARPATYSQPDATYWREVADPLADLLTHVWQLPGNQLRQHASAFEAFKILLGVLVARQHAVGLQLNQLVGKN